MKEKLGIKFKQVCKIFADKFVPKLMDLTLKDLRKAAEQDMGGVTSEDTSNIYNLKEVLKKTVKATKVARGSEAPKFDEAEQLLDENMAEQE